jgi:HK97 family phage portal protein
MGLLGKISGGALEAKMSATQEAIFRDIYGGSRVAKTGDTISWASALEVTTVLRCAVVYADTLGSIPFKLYGKDQAPAEGHPLADLVQSVPNGWQDSLEWRSTKAMHLALAGNAYDLISRRATDGTILELIPAEPGVVRVERGRDMLPRYFIRDADGKEQKFGPDEVWHWRGPSWNSWQGMDRVRLAREAIALAIATEAAHSRLHKNGIQVSGTYSIEGTLDDAGHKRLAAWIDKHRREENGGPLLLDRAAKWLQTAMSGVDAEHLSTRRYQVEEIARGLGVLPVMAGYTEGTTSYASVEQMLLAHAIHTARPLWRSFEKSAERWLLTKEDRAAGLYFKFSDGELLRGDAAARADYYSKALGAGGSPPWLTQNEVRAFDELPPRDEAWADELPRGTNPAGTAPNESPKV